MAYNFSSPHITSLFFNPHSLSLAPMHSNSSFSLYPSISLLSLPWLAIVLGGFMVVLRWFVGLILWLCSSRSWVWFRGFLLAMMGLNFVVVKFVGENVLDGVAVGLATGYGWLCFNGSDWFVGSTGSWFVGFFFAMDRGWFGRGSWLIWLIWFMDFFYCGLWFMGFFCLAVVGGCRLRSGGRGRLLGCGYYGIWLWLVGQQWRWFHWSKMTQTKCQHR